jgi:hypothetical protein
LLASVSPITYRLEQGWGEVEVVGADMGPTTHHHRRFVLRPIERRYDAGRTFSLADGTQSSSNEVIVKVSRSNWLRISTRVGSVRCGA